MSAVYYVLESRGTQSYGARVGTAREPERFATQREARAYADTITPSMPSKELPLVAVKVVTA